VSDGAISGVDLAAAHDGVAELVVTLRFDNGGEQRVALDAYAADHLMRACGVDDAAELVGLGWLPVRDALAASSNRFAQP
jgi:hypothetical protein